MCTFPRTPPPDLVIQNLQIQSLGLCHFSPALEVILMNTKVWEWLLWNYGSYCYWVTAMCRALRTLICAPPINPQKGWRGEYYPHFRVKKPSSWTLWNMCEVARLVNNGDELGPRSTVTKKNILFVKLCYSQTKYSLFLIWLLSMSESHTHMEMLHWYLF